MKSYGTLENPYVLYFSNQIAEYNDGKWLKS